MAIDDEGWRAKARSIIAAAQRGGQVPQDVQDAAIRIKNGSVSSADKRILSKFEGLGGKFKFAHKALQSFRQSLGAGMDSVGHMDTAIRDLERAQTSGSNLASAQNRFMSTMLGEIDKYAKTKLARTIVTSILRDTSQSKTLLRGLGSFARLGSTALGIAGMGIDAAEAYLGREKALSEGYAKNIETARAMGLSGERRRRIADTALSRARTKYFQQRNRIRVGLGQTGEDVNYAYQAIFGEGTDSQVIDKMAHEMADEEMHSLSEARSHTMELGLQAAVDRRMVKIAKMRGVRVTELTPQDHNEAIDATLEAARTVASRTYRGTGAGRQDLVGTWKTILSHITGGEITAEQKRFREDPVERFKRAREREFNQSAFQATRSRHESVISN